MLMHKLNSIGKKCIHTHREQDEERIVHRRCGTDKFSILMHKIAFICTGNLY